MIMFAKIFTTSKKKRPQCSYSAEQLSPSGSALVEHECQSNLCNPVVPQNFAGKTPVQEASGHFCFSVACTVAPKTYQLFKNIQSMRSLQIHTLFSITSIHYSIFNQIIRVDKEITSFKTSRERPWSKKLLAIFVFLQRAQWPQDLSIAQKYIFYHCNILLSFLTK